MSDDRQAYADQILRAIEYGKLPQEEIERRLQQILDEELSGPVDAAYNHTKVELCTSLLWEYYTHNEVDAEDSLIRIRQKADAAYVRQQRKRQNLFCTLGTVTAALVLLVGMTALSGTFPVQWFTGEPINQDQQYVLAGHEITTDLVASAIADHQGEGEWTCSQRAEVIQLIGFDPGLPDALNDELAGRDYHVLITDQLINISRIYGTAAETLDSPQAILRITLFTDMEQAYAMYEQDSAGETIVIQDHHVYRYQNDRRINYLWTEGCTVYRLTLQVSLPDESKVVERIMGKEEL